MFHVIAFSVLLVFTSGYALACGGSPERWAGAITLLASLITAVALRPVALRYHDTEWLVLAIDLAVLIAFGAIALRSTRWWPLWITGLHLTSLLAHVPALVSVEVPRAYMITASLMAYPIQIILAVATWRHRTRVRMFGGGRSWRLT